MLVLHVGQARVSVLWQGWALLELGNGSKLGQVCPCVVSMAPFLVRSLRLAVLDAGEVGRA
jgi:hypothetical protein